MVTSCPVICSFKFAATWGLLSVGLPPPPPFPVNRQSLLKTLPSLAVGKDSSDTLSKISGFLAFSNSISASASEIRQHIIPTQGQTNFPHPSSGIAQAACTARTIYFLLLCWMLLVFESICLLVR